MDKGNINTEVQSTEKSQIFGQKILESMEFHSQETLKNMKLRVQTLDQIVRNCKSEDESLVQV